MKRTVKAASLTQNTLKAADMQLVVRVPEDEVVVAAP